MLGGRTNHWGRHVPRFGPYDFKAKSRDGLGMDWPISYDDVAPYYDRTEKLIGVAGANAGLENHPDSGPGVLLPPRQAAHSGAGDPGGGARSGHPLRAVALCDPDPRHAPSPCAAPGLFQRHALRPRLRHRRGLPDHDLAAAHGDGHGALAHHHQRHGVAGSDQCAAAAPTAWNISTRTARRTWSRRRAVVLAASACESARLLLNSQGVAARPGQFQRPGRPQPDGYHRHQHHRPYSRAGRPPPLQ